MKQDPLVVVRWLRLLYSIVIMLFHALSRIGLIIDLMQNIIRELVLQFLLLILCMMLIGMYYSEDRYVRHLIYKYQLESSIRWILASLTTSTNQKILPTYKIMTVVEGRRSYEEAAIHKHTDNRCGIVLSG
jgi:hypothetical protein